MPYLFDKLIYKNTLTISFTDSLNTRWSYKTFDIDKVTGNYDVVEIYSLDDHFEELYENLGPDKKIKSSKLALYLNCRTDAELSYCRNMALHYLQAELSVRVEDSKVYDSICESLQLKIHSKRISYYCGNVIFVFKTAKFKNADFDITEQFDHEDVEQLMIGQLVEKDIDHIICIGNADNRNLEKFLAESLELLTGNIEFDVDQWMAEKICSLADEMVKKMAENSTQGSTNVPNFLLRVHLFDLCDPSDIFVDARIVAGISNYHLRATKTGLEKFLLDNKNLREIKFHHDVHIQPALEIVQEAKLSYRFSDPILYIER